LARIEAKEEVAQQYMTKVQLVKFNTFMKTVRAEEKRLSDPTSRENARRVRELYLDILLTPKSQNNRKYLEAKFKKLMIGVTDNRLKRMVAWKLSWWFPGMGKELFTMTEGERSMRKQTVITALLTAGEAGVLGEIDFDDVENIMIDSGDGKMVAVPVPVAYLSDTAKNIARNAVNNTMFGMSGIHLGEAFAGMGQQIGLYKAYPLQQMLHDHNVLKTFFAGGLGEQWHSRQIDNSARIMKAVATLAKNSWKGIPYDPNSAADHEAIAVVRFVALRVAATIVSIILEMLPFFRTFMRNGFTMQFTSMIRGGENPAVAIGLRLLINGLLMASMDDDEFLQGDMGMVGWDIARLFFPVFLTLPINLVTNWVD
jgi:hypothetical protein